MIPDSRELADFAVSGIARCYRRVSEAGWNAVQPKTSDADIDALRLMWALSNDVASIARRVAENPRALAGGMTTETIVETGRISGSVNARSTLLEQLVTSDPTRYVVDVPAVSHATRRNHVLAWVLREAERLALSLVRQPNLTPEFEWIHSRAALLELALRTKVLRDILHSTLGRIRPNAAAIRDCKKSLNSMYRTAARAFETLAAVEMQDAEAVSRVVSDTLVSRLENWQKLELCAVVAAAEALQLATGKPVIWKNSFTNKPAVQVGDFLVTWQYTVPARDEAQLDPSEKLVRTLLSALGATVGASRADVTVRHQELDVSHIECKWFESPGAVASAIVDATEQLVRYARDSRPTSITEAETMLRDCIIVCASTETFASTVDGHSGINFLDFRGLADGALADWATRLVATTGSATVATA